MAKKSAWAKNKESAIEARDTATRVRLSPSELRIMDAAAERHGFANRSQYLRYLIFRGSELAAAPPSGWSAIQQAAEALGPIGRNLNQAVKALHQGGQTPPDLQELSRTVEELRRHLAEYSAEGSKTLSRASRDEV